MKLFETMKNMKVTQNMNKTKNEEEHIIKNGKHPKYENQSTNKPVFVSKSDYGWDGDY